MKLKKRKKQKNQKTLLPVLFIVFLALFGLVVFLFSPEKDNAMPLSQAERKGCLLSYGESQCIDGILSIPFYNDGNKTITSAQIIIPTKRGVDVANISEPLAPRKTGAVQLSKCSKVDKTKTLKLKWCCEKCYETEMTKPSQAITISK